MFYTVYKITNNINGKIYIGCHKTTNINDNYMGSGKYLKYSQEKHGIENFTREILHIFGTPDEMFNKERELVNVEFVNESYTYNLKVGGDGGQKHPIGHHTNSIEHMKMMSIRAQESFNSDDYKQECRRQNSRKIMIKNQKEGKCITPYSWEGKKHTDETRKKMSKTAKERLKDPTNNSQFGTRWIYSLDEKRSRKIKNGHSLPAGWFEGRKINF